MKLYLVERTNQVGYDEYASAIVAAKDAVDALTISPAGSAWSNPAHCWATKDKLKATLIGTACRGTKKGIIHSQFNAG